MSPADPRNPPDSKNPSDPKSASAPGAPPPPSADEPPKRAWLRNETAYRIALDSRDRRCAIQLAPWTEYEPEPRELETLDLEPWTRRGLVTTGESAEGPDVWGLVASGVALGLFGVGFYGGVIGGIWELIGDAPGRYWRYVGLLMVVVAVLVPLVQLFKAGQLKELGRPAAGAVTLGGLFLTLLISFGVPAAVILPAEGCCTTPPAVAERSAAEGSDAAVAGAEAGAAPEGGAGGVPEAEAGGVPEAEAGGVPEAEAGAAPEGGAGDTDEAGAGADAGADAGEEPPGILGRAAGWTVARVRAQAPHMLGRGLQLLVIGILSALPALLYFLFDRRKLAGLRQRFFQSVVQLDPDLRTLEDARRVHGVRADEALGPASYDGKGPRIHFSRQLVILVATVVVTVGWVVALNPVGGPPDAVTTLFGYLRPMKDPLVFAFLGGYAFALWMLLRRYFRSDLKPEAYAHVVIRIIGAVLITWAVAELPFMTTDAAAGAGGESAEVPRGVLLALAFFVGWLPETGLFVIRESLRKHLVGMVLPDFTERLPLERLDGIDLYTRARLMDEGIENLEQLAHCDLVDLMLRTRIPLETLLDWIDQAILVLHVRGADDGEVDLEVLRSHGIRTATDLEAAFRQAVRRERGAEYRMELPDGSDVLFTLDVDAGQEVERFLSILKGEEGGPPRLRVILDALEDDPWMRQLERNRMPTPTSVVESSLLETWDRGEKPFLAALAALEAAERAGADRPVRRVKASRIEAAVPVSDG